MLLSPDETDPPQPGGIDVFPSGITIVITTFSNGLHGCVEIVIASTFLVFSDSVSLKAAVPQLSLQPVRFGKRWTPSRLIYKARHKVGEDHRTLKVFFNYKDYKTLPREFALGTRQGKLDGRTIGRFSVAPRCAALDIMMPTP